MDACEHCGGKLVVYSSRMTAKHRLQHRRCKSCKRPAESKRVPNELVDRVSSLEAEIKLLKNDLKSVLSSM